MFAATTGETFGGGYQVCPGVTPVDKEGSIVYAPRLSRIAMLSLMGPMKKGKHIGKWGITQQKANRIEIKPCLLYTSPSPRDGLLSRMPSSA